MKVDKLKVEILRASGRPCEKIVVSAFYCYGVTGDLHTEGLELGAENYSERHGQGMDASVLC